MMALSDLTANSVISALKEFETLGRDAFLARYGKARSYFVRFSGKLCDSKAVAGAAHGFLQGMAPLQSQEFSGGERSVAARLRELGFEVLGPSQSAAGVINFEAGTLYNRRQDIHDVYGGQQQGGICTPQGVPFIFLFTGESGNQFGYKDGPQSDGTFAYTGEGQRGDMVFIRGNRAIRDHVATGKDLLLFEATSTRGVYRFLGCYACGGWTTETRPDAEGAPRSAIVFQLIPISSEITEDVASGPKLSMDELRLAAYAAAATPSKPPKDARRSFLERSAAVKTYVLARARGRCEACGADAPFFRKDGTPYLEPHHTKRVADGGPDHPAWVGAVCPTCHREIHHGQNGAACNERLQQHLARIEQEPTTAAPVSA